GAQGFGRLHHLHTDRLLSLSEDLPAVSVAVDSRERIEAILDDVRALQGKGLITLERARLLTGQLEGGRVGEAQPEATKLTIYLGRQERADGRPAFLAVCELLYRCGVAGATVLLGVDGTRLGQRSRAAFFSRNADVPLMVIAVGSSGRIAAALPELSRMLARPAMTLERIRICKRDGELLDRPQLLPGTDERDRSLWQKLMIYGSESAEHQSGRPLHLELMRRLRASDALGATTVRGIWGFHGDHPPHGDRFLQLRRHVPVVTIVVDSPQRIAASFQIIDELTGHRGLVTSELVPALSAISEHERRGGLRLARHDY
ncbi:MAG TPA: DUF190 domain-containing protein, partial [Solirubrobacteraceae bacterium]